MESREKTLPFYFNTGENRTTEAGVHPCGNHVGIIASITIHAIFMLFFVLQPTARMVTVKTFNISFAEGGASLLKSPEPPVVEGKKETAPMTSPVRRPAPPAQPKTAGVHRETVATVPQTRASGEPPPAVDRVYADTTLPPVSQNARGSEFIAAAVNIPAPGPATSGGISASRGTPAGAAFPAAGSGGEKGSAAGTETGAGNGSLTGNGNGVPLQTSFGAMNAPSFIHRAMPVYPPLARRRGKEGRVVLTLLIDQTGKLKEIDVTEPAGYGLTEAAIEAVRNSTFAPARVNGQKVASRAILPIRFQLE